MSESLLYNREDRHPQELRMTYGDRVPESKFAESGMVESVPLTDRTFRGFGDLVERGWNRQAAMREALEIGLAALIERHGGEPKVVYGGRRGKRFTLTLPDGTEHVFVASSMKSALDAARAKLGRKRLPNGSTWEKGE